MDGFLIVDKPRGLSSHDVCAHVKHLLNARRVGHCGTLDPEATGVLLIAIGKATKFFPFLLGLDKIYEGTIRLGFSTDTYDATGQATSPLSENLPTSNEVLLSIKKFEGDIIQTPPPFSAKKINGQPAYRLARAKKTVSLKPEKKRIYFFTLLAYQPPDISFKIRCSSGTYIRSLAHDLGKALGCGGHLLSLRRLAVGNFTMKEAVSLDRLIEVNKTNSVDSYLIPIEKILPDMPSIRLKNEAIQRAINGAPICLNHIEFNSQTEKNDFSDDEVLKIFSLTGKFIGLGRFSREKVYILPFLVINDMEKPKVGQKSKQ